MNKVEVLERLNPMVEGEIRNIKNSDGARVIVEDGTVGLRTHRGARLIDMGPEGVKSVTHFVGLPLHLARELSHTTFSQALSELLEQTGKYSLIVKDNRVVNMMPYGAQTAVNPERLLNTIEGAIPVHDYLRLSVLKDKPVVSLEIVGEATQPVAKGDLVRAGVKIGFSPMGITKPVVQSYAEVLACTNGAISNVVLAEFAGGGRGGGEGDSVWQFFRTSVRKAYRSFDSVVGEWKKLLNENIPSADRARILAALLKKAGMGREVSEALMAMAVERPPRNAWEMHNLLTYASTHLLQTPTQIARTQQTAADFADETGHAKTCPLCHRTS
jgi:hypothetical protein